MNNELLDSLQKAGLVIVNIPPFNGAPTKGPQGLDAIGWNRPYSETNRKGYGRPLVDVEMYNYGLLHSASKTIAFDLDHLELCKELFLDVSNLNVEDLLNDPARFEIKSPKQNRGKLIFKLPDGVVINTVKKLNRDKDKKKESIFELRGGDNQDVIVGTHPEGGEYKIIGDPEKIPVCPDVLLNMALNWDDWKPCFDSFLYPAQPKQEQKNKKPKVEGQIDAIKEFNGKHDLRDILTRNGYKPMGKRFIRPNSSSGSPGVVIYNDFQDGIERIYSNGADDLSNGHCLSSFDCFKILECGGDFKKAIRWSESINQHNDKVWKESKKKEKPMQEKDHKLTDWINADDMADNAKAPRYLINNIIETNTHGLIAGSSQSFKSFCVLKMAHSICTGKDFFNNDVYEQGKVVYICGEGLGALGRRIKALKLVEGDFGGNLHILNKPMFIDNIADMKWLEESLEMIKPVFVIYDTFSSLATSTKENANEEVARTLRMVSDCCSAVGACSVVVHHYGKDAEKGSRGGSAFSANVDFEISMVRTIGTMNAVMSCKKSKDGDFFDDIEIIAHVVDLGLVRQDGSNTSSLVLKNGEHGNELTDRQKRAFEAIVSLLIEEGHFINGVNIVTKDQIKKCFVNEFKEQSGKYAIFGKVVPALLKKGVLCMNDSGYFVKK